MRLQLTAWYGAVFATLLASLGLLVYWLLSTNLRRDAESQLATRAVQLASTLNVDESGINFQESQLPGELALLYSSKGALLESSSRIYSPPVLPAWTSQGAGKGAYETVALPDGRWLMYAGPIAASEPSASAGAGAGTLIIGRSLEPIYELLNQTVSVFAMVGPIVLLLACVGGYFLAGRALAPVAAITRTAQRIQAEGLGRRIGMEGREDELGKLAATFDSMLARLEETFARERRFTSDAAHELRTPLAVIRAESSLALSKSRTPDEYRRVLQVVDGESSRMGKLMGDLLTLARADVGKYHLLRKAVDLTALCQKVAAQMEVLARDKQITLTTDIAEGIRTIGDDAWLMQMLNNLLDNGIKYTQSGGWVKLTLARKKDNVAIVVEDNGIGMTEEQLAHIFDRFYRADKARGRDNSASGSGLGLAICEWIAISHGMHIGATSQIGNGSAFEVVLPADIEELRTMDDGGRARSEIVG